MPSKKWEGEKVVLRPTWDQVYQIISGKPDWEVCVCGGTITVLGSPVLPETTCLMSTPSSVLEFGGWSPRSNRLFNLELIFLSHSLSSGVISQPVLVTWSKLGDFEREEAGES